MRKLWLSLLLLSLFLALPVVSAADDVCDNISDGADGWAVLADAVDEIADHGGPTPEEARNLDEAIGELLNATIELGEVMVDQGNSDEERLGRSLLRSCRRLERADTFDEIVGAMDDITEDLDSVVGYCDAQ